MSKKDLEDTSRANSFQLLDLLRSEVALLREILSHYSLEELVMRQGNDKALYEIKDKQAKLHDEVDHIREEKKQCRARNTEKSDLEMLHMQIEALDNEIHDKRISIQMMVPESKYQIPPVEKKKLLLDEET